MIVIGWGIIALAAWLLDSAIRNRPPIETLKEIVTTGTLPVIGKSYPARSHRSTTDTAAATGSASAPVAVNIPATGGNVSSWIAQANAILQQNGYAAGQLDIASQEMIIHYESGGDPAIVNTTDSNARAGHPSIGLGQTIQPTFNAYALPGHTTITNPVDNIIAFTRYAIAKYGSLSNVPGVKAVRNGGKYTGY